MLPRAPNNTNTNNNNSNTITTNNKYLEQIIMSRNVRKYRKSVKRNRERSNQKRMCVAVQADVLLIMYDAHMYFFFF